MDSNTEFALQVAGMSLKALYKNYLSQVDEDDETEIEDVRNGVRGLIEINIQDIIDEDEGKIPEELRYIKVNRMKQKVIIGNKAYRLDDYRKEKERRETIIRKRLLSGLEHNPWSGN